MCLLIEWKQCSYLFLETSRTKKVYLSLYYRNKIVLAALIKTAINYNTNKYINKYIKFKLHQHMTKRKQVDRSWTEKYKHSRHLLFHFMPIIPYKCYTCGSFLQCQTSSCEYIEYVGTTQWYYCFILCCPATPLRLCVGEFLKSWRYQTNTITPLNGRQMGGGGGGGGGGRGVWGGSVCWAEKSEVRSKAHLLLKSHLDFIS